VAGAEVGAKIESGAFGSGSWFKAFSSCVKPPCAGGPDAAGGGAAGSLKRKPLSFGIPPAGSAANGFNASRSGVDCGDIVENICVNEPGLELFGGSAKEGAGGAAKADGSAADGGAGLGAVLGAPLAGSP
jgi:hypothetical protein